MLSVEVQEDMREAANNLVKHFHKPEQEVCGCNSECVPQRRLLHPFNLLAHEAKIVKLTNAFLSPAWLINLSCCSLSPICLICVSE